MWDSVNCENSTCCYLKMVLSLAFDIKFEEKLGVIKLMVE